MIGRAKMTESSASSNTPCSTEIPLNPGTADSESKIIQETAHQEEETLRQLKITELKELCNKALGFFRQENPSSREMKLILYKVLNALNHPTSNPSTKHLDLTKNQISSMIQCAIRRQQTFYVPHQQLPPQVHAQEQFLQPQSPIPVAPCQNLNRSQMRSTNAYSSAVAAQQNNVRNLQDYVSPSPQLATSITMSSQQQLTKSLEERGSSLKSAHQNSMGSSQLPEKPLQSGSVCNLLSQSHGRVSQPNLIHAGFSHVTTHPIYSNQHKEQHHAAAVTNLRVSFQANHIQTHFKPEASQQPKQQLAAHQIPQGTAYNKLPPGLNEVKNLNRRHETSKISGVSHHTSATQLQHLMSGVERPLSSARIYKPECLQISQRSCQTNHQNYLVNEVVDSSNSSSNVPSPTPIANPKSEKHSNASSTLNTGNIGRHITDTSPLTKRCDVVPTSHSVVQHGNTDETGFKASTPRPVESSDAEDPIRRLIKALSTVSSKARDTALGDIKAVASQADCIATRVPRWPVPEDLRTKSGVEPEARHSSRKCIESETINLKHSIIPSPTKRRASTDMEISDVMMTTSPVKRTRIEVKHLLVKEIEEINQRLIDTVVSIDEDHINSTARGTSGYDDTIVKCSFSAVTVTPRLNLQEASSGILPIEPLHLLVPADYPSFSPTVLQGQLSEEHGDLSGKAMVELQRYLRSLSQPISVGEIARAWDARVRAVILEYAKQNGGGTFSSKYGTWEKCL